MIKVRSFNVRVNGQNFEVEVEEVAGEKPRQAAPPAPLSTEVAPNGKGKVVAPMPGVITVIKVDLGDEVVVGQALVTLEAMKMENEIPASKAGSVQAIHVNMGQTVASGDLLVEIG